MYFCIETKCYGYENKNNTEDTVCQCIMLLDIGKLPVAGLDVLRSCGRKIRENACIELFHPNICRFPLQE